MKIKAKMKCQTVTKNAYSQEVVCLQAVYEGDSKENRSFAKATPSASVEITIDNPDAIGAFEAGEEYYVDFTPAD